MRYVKMRCVMLLTILPSLFCQASEKDELALVLRQLDQVQAGLERARVIADQSVNERFYFDYQQALHDITTMKQGINGYLAPSRAQPVPPNVISGQYRAEAASWQ
jgi:RAQPRD family integrative conjugative element protein